ncbi:MAG: hypothetical protein ACOYMA_11145 [Bacteroidia bacterium]
MIKKILYIIAILPLFCFAQKNNYNTFAAYDDEYLNQILYSERFVTSYSDYLLFGKVNNLYIELRDKDNKLAAEPSKTFYDRYENLVKIINFNNLQISNIIEFYYIPKYGGNGIYKSTLQYINGVPKCVLSSKIDTLKSLIIVSSFSDNKIDEIDSVFYTKNFKPLTILKYNRFNKLESIYKASYLENGKVYKEVHKRHSSLVSGGFNKYDSNGRMLYSHSLSFEEFDKSTINYVDSNKVKDKKFVWYNNKDFKLQIGTNDNVEYNEYFTFSYSEKTLHGNVKKESTIIKFNNSLLPVKKLYFDKKNNFSSEIGFGYNDYNDLISQKINIKGEKPINKTFKYIYDNKNNWIERREFEDGKLIFTTIRKIEYY